MLKLVCPKCHLNLRVSERRVPEKGGWALCPRCRERFFINPGGSSIEDLTRPFVKEPPDLRASAAGGSRTRNSSNQELLDQLKAKRGQRGEPDYDPGLIIVHPESGIPDFVYRTASLAMLCLPLVAIYLVFASTNTRLNQVNLRPEPVTTAVERLNNQEDPELIRKDLTNLKRDHVMRRRSLYGVGYSSPESRVFKYFMNRLAPDVCSGIRYLRVAAPVYPGSQPGFTMTGLCLEPEGRRLEMRVDWMGSSNSRITFPYNNRSEIFPLYSASGGDAELQPAGAASPGAAAAAAALTRRPLAVETATRPVAGSLD